MWGDLTARDVKTEKLLWTTGLGNELTWALASWNGGTELLVADEGRSVSRFDSATGRKLPPLGKFDITPLSLSVSVDEKRLALGGYGGKPPIVIDSADHVADAFRSMKFTDPKVQANQVSLSPDGKHLASACTDGTVKMCETTTGELLVERKEHTGVLGGVQFSPDGKRLLTVGPDAIKVWDVVELLKPEGGTNERGCTPEKRVGASGDEQFGGLVGKGARELIGGTGSSRSTMCGHRTGKTVVVIFRVSGKKSGRDSSSRPSGCEEVVSGGMRHPPADRGLTRRDKYSPE